MRAPLLLASVLAVSVAAHAQKAPADIRPGHEPGVGDSLPLSGNASNMAPGDTRSVIAPTLPRPAGGPNQSIASLLAEAQKALAARKTGLAEESLERAETAMLQRSVPQEQAATPDAAPDVLKVQAARAALGRHDMAAAKQAVAEAMAAGG